MRSLLVLVLLSLAIVHWCNAALIKKSFEIARVKRDLPQNSVSELGTPTIQPESVKATDRRDPDFTGLTTTELPSVASNSTQSKPSENLHGTHETTSYRGYMSDRHPDGGPIFRKFQRLQQSLQQNRGEYVTYALEQYAKNVVFFSNLFNSFMSIQFTEE